MLAPSPACLNMAGRDPAGTHVSRAPFAVAAAFRSAGRARGGTTVKVTVLDQADLRPPDWAKQRNTTQRKNHPPPRPSTLPQGDISRGSLDKNGMWDGPEV